MCVRPLLNLRPGRVDPSEMISYPTMYRAVLHVRRVYTTFFDSFLPPPASPWYSTSHYRVPLSARCTNTVVAWFLPFPLATAAEQDLVALPNACGNSPP